MGREVPGDRAGRSAEGGEVGIPARVGAQVQLLAASREAARRDLAAAFREGAAEGVALLEEVEEEGLRVGHRAAAVDAQLSEREPTARVARKPVGGPEGAVRNEVRLVARPSP